jgi:hypothetical protein
VLLEARDEDGRPLTDAEIGDEVAMFLLARAPSPSFRRHGVTLVPFR